MPALRAVMFRPAMPACRFAVLLIRPFRLFSAQSLFRPLRAGSIAMRARDVSPCACRSAVRLIRLLPAFPFQSLYPPLPPLWVAERPKGNERDPMGQTRSQTPLTLMKDK